MDLFELTFRSHLVLCSLLQLLSYTLSWTSVWMWTCTFSYFNSAGVAWAVCLTPSSSSAVNMNTFCLHAQHALSFNTARFWVTMLNSVARFCLGVPFPWLELEIMQLYLLCHRDKMSFRVSPWQQLKTLMSRAVDSSTARRAPRTTQQDGVWPGRGTPTETLQSCGHRYAKSFRSAVRVAYPLTGTLLLISHGSADCISSVRNLPSHPAGVNVSGVRGSICLPSVERQPTCRADTRREDTQTWTWSLLHESSV